LQKQGHTSDVIKQLLDEKNGISCQARTAKLSIKALNEFIPLLFKSSSGEILSNFVLNRKILQKEDYSNMSFKQAFLKNVANEILSPSVKRSCWEFIKILSKLKLDKNVDTNIVIELPRATNSKEQRKLESELQKINKERKEKIEKKYKKYEIKNQNFDEATIYRLALFDSQDGKDIYTGKPLKIQDVINNVNMHIDHILAKSITCDNTSHNKVLTTLDNNKNKGIMTPYEFLGTKFEKIKKQYWDNLLKNHMISQQKYSNLSRVTPLNKDALGFVARNITDTGYISCLLSEFLQKFYENTSIKIIISNGKFTNFIRSKILKVNKDRKFYSHHGVDAVCCSIVGMLPKTTIDKMR
jgi:CRISPR-associated endonuclease Csn1